MAVKVFASSLDGEKPACFICRTGRFRNLLQVKITGFYPNGDDLPVLMCYRCLLGLKAPAYPREKRYLNDAQTADVIHFKQAFHKLYSRYSVGSVYFFKVPISQIDNTKLKEVLYDRK